MPSAPLTYQPSSGDGGGNERTCSWNRYGCLNRFCDFIIFSEVPKGQLDARLFLLSMQGRLERPVDDVRILIGGPYREWGRKEVFERGVAQPVVGK